MSILKPNLTDQQSNLLSYIPNTLLSKYFRRSAAPTTTPAAQHSRALILSTNILHFSNITQTYLKDHPNGLELIANLHKEFVELIQEYVKGTGADMLRYNTDRVMFYWEIPSIDTEECLDRLSNVLVYKILQLKNVLKQRFIRQGAQVSFSFVFTEGSFTTFSLGNAKTTVDHVYGGHSLLEALECPRPDPDDVWIFVSQRIVERIQTDFVINALENENKTPFFLVAGVMENSRIASSSIEGVDIRRMVKPEQFDKIFKEVGSYIPKCLDPFIQNGIDLWGNELRKVTTMFLNIPLDIQDIQSEQGLVNLQNIVTKVRKSVQEYNGFIYRFYLDSKGIYMFVLFGLYPDCHPEDSMKCMLSALSINENLAKVGVAVYTGISTGEVLLSICGSYQKDLFIIGEPLYTAFLLSLVSLRDGSIRIMVDFESKVAAESKLSFQLYKNPIFTGKIAEGIFQIMYSGEPLPQTTGDDCPEIRTHRFNVDYSESNTLEEKVTSLFMTGRDTELQSAKRIFSQFIKAPTKPNVLLLVGSYGVGKSLFAKNLAESIHQIIDKTPLTTDVRPEIFASSISPINKKKRLNGWRFFMRDILDRLAFAESKSREEYLTSLFANESDLKANIRLLKDILNLNLPQPKPSPTKGAKTKKTGTAEEEEAQEETNSKPLPPSEQALVVRALIVLLQKFVGEKEEKKTSSSLNKSTTSASPTKSTTGVSPTKSTASPPKEPVAEKNNLPPIILCLDDLQEFDELSWDLLTKSVKRVQRIFIVGILRDDEVNKRSMKNIQTGLKDLGANRALTLNKITLESLNQEDIGILTKRMLGNREPSDEIKNFVATRCEGNPLMVINMLDSLIKQGLLQEETGVVFPSEELSRLIELGEYIEIKVPSPKTKIIGSMLDDLTMLHYNLLKFASAIGETFDLKSLVVTNPFHYTLIPYNVMLSLLQELTQGGILQLVANRNRNLIYKFKTPFTRETVYQRMSFAQRRRLHRALALNYESEKSPEEDQRLMYQWYLSEQGGHKQKVDGSLLRKISTLNSQPTRRGEVVIKTGDLEKKSVKTEHKWWPRFGALTQQALKYYRSERDFNEKPVLEAGSIVLKGITMIDVRSFDVLEGTGNHRMMTQKPGMFIHTEKYYKGQKPMERRDYSFVCESQEEAEDWVLCIEYMRNKAVYEDFLQTVDPDLLNVRVERVRESSPTQDNKMKFWSPSVAINQEIYQMKNSLTRDGSPDKRSGVWPRSSSPFYDDDEDRGSLQNSESMKRNRNKEIVRTFLEKGQLSFWASLFNAPLKGSLKGRNFGKTSDLLRERQDLLKVEGDLLRHEPSRVSIVENEPRPRQLTFGINNNEIERFRNNFEEEQTVVKKTSGVNNALFRGGRVQQSNDWSEKSFQTGGDNNDSLNYARSVNSIGENSFREGQTVTKKEFKTNNNNERRSIRPGANEISYRDDTYVEMVEEVVKSKLLRNSGFSSNSRRGNTDMRSDGKNTVRITFFPKSVRDLSKPNIYGRYQFFPTFFIDSVVDDKVFASKPSNIKDLTRAKTTKVNIPNAGEMVFKLRYEDGQNVFVMNEESHERLKNSQQRTLASASRLEDEAPVYKPVIKQLQNFVWENYGGGNNNIKQSPAKPEFEETQFNRTFESPEVTKAHSRNNSSSYYNMTPTTQANRNPTNIREYNPGSTGGSASKLSPLDIYKNKVMAEMSRDSNNDSFPSFGGGVESSQRSLGEDSVRKFMEPYQSSPGKPDLDDLKQHIENYNDTLGRVYGGGNQSTTIGGGYPGSGQKPANIRAYGGNTSSPLDKYLIDQSRNYGAGNQLPSDTIKRSTSPINYDRRPSPFKEPMVSSPNELYRNYPSPIETYSANKYNSPAEGTYTMKQTTTNVPPIQNFVTPSFTAIPSSTNEDLKIHKASPASNERFSPAVNVRPLTGAIPSTDFFCMGRIRRNTRSQDGDIFNLGPREMVIVTRVYDKRGLVELLWNGLTGLFPLDDVELLKLEDGDKEQARLAMSRGPGRSQNNSGQDYYMSYESRSDVESLPRFGGAGEESTIINTSSMNNSSMTGGSGMPSKMMQRQLRKMQKNNILDKVLDN